MDYIWLRFYFTITGQSSWTKHHTSQLIYSATYLDFFFFKTTASFVCVIKIRYVILFDNLLIRCHFNDALLCKGQQV